MTPVPKKGREPPFDESPTCPACPEAIRNLYAVAHNFAIGSRDTTIGDLKNAADAAKPYIDAHFADTLHSAGRLKDEHDE